MRNFFIFTLGVCFLLAGDCNGKNKPPVKPPKTPKDNKKKIDYGKIDSKELATVKGKINFTGEAPKIGKSKVEKCVKCEKKYENGKIPEELTVINKNNTVKNVLVYIKKGHEGITNIPVPTDTPVMDQNLCRYEPHVIAIMAGQSIKFLNSDPCEHNVNGAPRKNSPFNYPQASKGKSDTHKFVNAEPKPLKVGCQIHTWMEAWIHVLPHTFFAVTGDDGTFEIKGLPAGKYTLEAWHEDKESFKTQTIQIEVKEGEIKEQDFTFKLE